MNKKLNKKQLVIVDWLLSHPGYLKKSAVTIWSKSYIEGAFLSDIVPALAKAKIEYKEQSKPLIYPFKPNKTIKKAVKEYKKDTVVLKSFAEIFPWSTDNKKREVLLMDKLKPVKKNVFDKDNVIFLADLHAPHILDGYLEWCKELQEKYNCGTVIMAGDIIDSGAWNYHEKNPDLPGVKDELYAAKKQLKKVFEMFPEAISLFGNHDLLISRKLKTAGLSQSFMKDFGEILEAPKAWKFVHEYKKDNVLYKHGAVGDAFKAATESRISTCQGHFHAKSFVQWSVSEKDAIFGLQVGGGFDRDQMAFDYAKPFHKKPIISCGLILDKGTTPIVKIMPL